MIVVVPPYPVVFHVNCTTVTIIHYTRLNCISFHEHLILIALDRRCLARGIHLKYLRTDCVLSFLPGSGPPFWRRLSCRSVLGFRALFQLSL
jgi:hypothetical protein